MPSIDRKTKIAILIGTAVAAVLFVVGFGVATIPRTLAEKYADSGHGDFVEACDNLRELEDMGLATMALGKVREKIAEADGSDFPELQAQFAAAGVEGVTRENYQQVMSDMADVMSERCVTN